MQRWASLFVLGLMGIALPAHATWHAILISGDASIDNFDNSRVVFGSLLEKRGLTQQQHLHSQFPDPLLNNNTTAHLLGVAKSFNRLNVQPKQDGCLFYITSHGNRGKGMYLQHADSESLLPHQLNTALNWQCGSAPTVILLSGCYSGQFIPTLKAPNRIILTAASSKRPSFGCSEDTEYTFWDGCLIENFPTSDTWQQLSDRLKQCIVRKEQALAYPASLPQAYFGASVRDLPIRF